MFLLRVRTRILFLENKTTHERCCLISIGFFLHATMQGMSIETYIHFVTGTSFPFLFLILVIVAEYIVRKRKGKTFSFFHVFSNFGVLFIGMTLFLLFNHFVLKREDVLAFTTEHSLFSFPVSWGYFFLWLIVFDFINYWTHVFYHKLNFFWMFHSVHHSDKDLCASTTIRVPVTASFFTVTSYAFLSFFGISIVLLPALAQTMFLQQILVHSFLFRGVLPSYVSLIFITPDIHALHHTEKYATRNYGFLFSIWDRLFKTAEIKEHTTEVFGVESSQETNNPFSVHFRPIRTFFKRK